MSEPRIHRIPSGIYAVNCYIAACPETRAAAVIDPAGDEHALVRHIHELGLDVRYILNTHGHPDHVETNTALAELTGAPTAMHEADAAFFASPEGRRMAEEELRLPPGPAPDILLADGQILEVGTLEIEVIHTPGHTPGSVCYRIKDNLFTGDTLFVGAAGRTDLTGADLMTLVESIRTRIVPLPGHVIIWPGHDYGDTPTSTVAREREENPFITDF